MIKDIKNLKVKNFLLNQIKEFKELTENDFKKYNCKKLLNDNKMQNELIEKIALKYPLSYKTVLDAIRFIYYLVSKITKESLIVHFASKLLKKYFIGSFSIILDNFENYDENLYVNYIILGKLYTFQFEYKTKILFKMV